MGEMNDLEESVRIARQSLQSTPLNQPDRVSYMSGLTDKLSSRYERIGEMTDLEEAIQLARQALESTTLGHSDHTARSNNLGICLGRRYERSGEMEDLAEAITIARQAVKSTPIDRPERNTCLTNLANMLRIRYERTREIEDLHSATNVAREAVQSTPYDHPDCAIRLNVYSINLAKEYKRTRQAKDLEKAIDNARQSLQILTSGEVARGRYLTNLGTMLGDLYDKNGVTSHLEEAIDTARQAVQSIPMDHPDHAVCLNNLGNRLLKQVESTGRVTDLEEVSQCYLRAFESTVGRPLDRARAAARYISISARLSRSREGITVGKAALALLPTINTRNLDRNDQQFVLSGFAGIASDLCALLVAEGQLQDAVECLEEGRTIIISRLLDDRSDISRLCQSNPQLAQRYTSLVTEVNLPFYSTERDAITSAKLSRRREAVMELESCLKDIRATPGGERFLLGQTVVEMQNDIGEGCIVIVNVSTIRSDAIVMTRHTLQAIPL